MRKSKALVAAALLAASSFLVASPAAASPLNLNWPQGVSEETKAKIVVLLNELSSSHNQLKVNRVALKPKNVKVFVRYKDDLGMWQRHTIKVRNPKSNGGGTPVVPIPAAAWLFGSGLLGLAGIGYRRRKTQG